jgi:hypothetical protein
VFLPHHVANRLPLLVFVRWPQQQGNHQQPAFCLQKTAKAEAKKLSESFNSYKRLKMQQWVS